MEKVREGVSQLDFFLNLKSHFATLKASDTQLSQDISDLRSKNNVLLAELQATREMLALINTTKEVAELRVEVAELRRDLAAMKEILSMQSSRPQWTIEGQVRELKPPPKRIGQRREAKPSRTEP